jgi:CheY-like chemotaxis protein
MYTNQETILHIDDDENDHRLLKEALICSGVKCSLHPLNNGIDAIAYLLAEGPFQNRNTYRYPSLIITDLNMPCCDGLSFLHWRMDNPSAASVPTIVLTSSKDPAHVTNAISFGATAYHLKPATFAELCDLIKRLVDYRSICCRPQRRPSGELLLTGPDLQLRGFARSQFHAS